MLLQQTSRRQRSRGPSVSNNSYQTVPSIEVHRNNGLEMSSVTDINRIFSDSHSFDALDDTSVERIPLLFAQKFESRVVYTQSSSNCEYFIYFSFFF